ncbi:MAG TPA: hypothetical protein PKI03_27725, partial [Pseudomonadota bacterium]|nr:hypothetical protein [Pseudomonadota bacterium]
MKSRQTEETGSPAGLLLRLVLQQQARLPLVRPYRPSLYSPAAPPPPAPEPRRDELPAFQPPTDVPDEPKPTTKTEPA